MTILKSDSGTSWANQQGRNGSVFDTLGFTSASDGHRVVDVAHTSLLGANSSRLILNGSLATPRPPVIAGARWHLVRKQNGDSILSISVVCVWLAAHAVPVLTSSATVPILTLLPASYEQGLHRGPHRSLRLPPRVYRSL